MQLCSTTVERRKEEKKKKKKETVLPFVFIFRAIKRSARENSFSQTKKARRGKTAVARQRRGWERGGERDESNVSQKRPLTIMLETR